MTSKTMNGKARLLIAFLLLVLVILTISSHQMAKTTVLRLDACGYLGAGTYKWSWPTLYLSPPAHPRRHCLCWVFKFEEPNGYGYHYISFFGTYFASRGEYNRDILNEHSSKTPFSSEVMGDQCRTTGFYRFDVEQNDKTTEPALAR